MSTLKAPVALVILDGWGLGKQDDPSNAIVAAKTPNMTALLQEYPTTALECSGEAVGLPDGQMGNSEVGHLNIGAGRVVYQELTRITKAIREGEFYNNDVLKSVVENVKKNDSAPQTGQTSGITNLFQSEGLFSFFTFLFMKKTDIFILKMMNTLIQVT